MASALKDSFVHLHVHSAYSLAEGAIQVKDVIGLCQDNDMPAVAVTDTNNLFGALEFALAAAKGGVQPIVGCQINLGLEGHQLVLLVQDQKGWLNLSKLVSDSFLLNALNTAPHATWEQLESCADGLLCLTGGIKGPVAQYLLHNQSKEAEAALKRLKKIFSGRLYVELQRHGWPEEDRIEDALIDLAYKHDVPLVATNDCYFPERKMHEAHDALLCIAEGRYVTEDDRRKVTPEHYFKSAAEMRDLFADLPEAVDNTLVIARRCGFLLKAVKPILPPFKTDAGRDEKDELREQAKAGLEWRLRNFVIPSASSRSFAPSPPPSPHGGEGDEAQPRRMKGDEVYEALAKPYHGRLEYELDMIIRMGFAGYFLIVSDFIKWAKDHNIPVGPGRGSGAGSIVAWALRITDLDPMKMGLLFERMLNPERVSMPDFDVDFCQDRRDEVIRYVQKRYGHDRVAQIITFGKLQARAVVRDVGRVLQMPYGQVDRIAKMIPANPANPVTLGEALEADPDLRNECNKEETSKKLIDIALQLEGLYRHASTHAAGVVIGDRPLHELTPLYRDPRSDMPVTQYNMKYVEQAGLVKFDFLGLKTMTVIQKTVDLIKKTQGKTVDILQVPLDDDKTFQILREGKTTGVFQLESAGMRDVAKQMKMSNFEQIIALVALYRPGPMDNIPKYLACLHGKEERDYMHPKLKPVLEETYGIMIYQEQVMRAAQVLSGYSLGGADLLRRAMGKKIQSEMDAQRAQFVKGAWEHSQVPEDQANYIFDQIDKFAGYGFNKSHAAAYALIAYWTAWLKANYPVEFMAASMTLDIHNTDKLAIFKQELDRMGIKLMPPDINKSASDFYVDIAHAHISAAPSPPPSPHGGEGVRSAGAASEGGTAAIWYALGALKGVGTAAMEKIAAERSQKGPFKNLEDFINRLDPSVMNKRQFEALAAAGAFDSLHANRTQVYESTEILLRHAQNLKEERSSGQVSLFGGGDSGSGGLGMPALAEVQAWDPLEKLRHEFDAVGFYLSAHPLDSKAGQLERMNVIPTAEAAAFMAHRSGAVLDMAGVLLKKQIKVSSRSGNKYAFLQMSDSTGVYEVTMFSETLAKTRDILNEGDSFLLKIIAEVQEDQVRYTVQDIRRLDLALASKVREAQIHLETIEPVAPLKKLLEADGRGAVAVTVIVETAPDKTAIIQLPGKWNFSPATRNALLRGGGVSAVQEL